MQLHPAGSADTIEAMLRRVLLMFMIISILPFATAAEPYQEGIASWYAGEFDGRLTANGETYDADGISAAHKELPFGTIVRVTNTGNNLFLDVRINDRGPFVEGRIIDLSRGAATALGMVEAGIAPVTLEILYLPEQPESAYRRPGDTGWVQLQVGAFADPFTVLECYFLLKKQPYPVDIEETENGLYRLLLRHIPYNEHEQFLTDLASMGFTSPLILSDEPSD